MPRRKLFLDRDSSSVFAQSYGFESEEEKGQRRNKRPRKGMISYHSYFLGRFELGEQRPQIDSIINDYRDSGLEDSGNGGSEIDQEAWTGIDAEGGDLDAMPVSEDEAQRRTGKKGKKPPTGEELRAIKDATDLFRSSSFKLQVSPMLQY